MSSKQHSKGHSASTSHSTSSLPSQEARQMELPMTSLRRAPTPPSSPLPPSPPPSPCPWLWRCHSCYTIYRLAVTRRCLDCDHTFCLGEPSTASSPPPKGRKRKRGGPCRAEFDYAGWKARGAWRRTVLLNGGSDDENNNINNKPVSGSDKNARGSEAKGWGDEHGAAAGAARGDEARFEDRRERLFLRRRHDCSIHCDFPSQCHHALFRAQQEGRPILRAAEALDAAAAAAEEEEEERGREGRRRARRVTVHEYKQRRAAERRSRASSSSRFVEEGLPAVGEAGGEGDGDVSPCSPASPDPPGDLMREVVSPVDNDNDSDGDDGDDDEQQPLSPGGRRRASLLVTTDTPAGFAATAAQLSFDDTCSDDDEGEERRTKSRRKIAQLTGEGPASFGPFILDTSAAPSPSPPTSPLAATATATAAGKDTDDLQAAYSEQAWFSPSSATSEPLSPRGPERAGKRDRMFALLGRRGTRSRPQQHRPPQLGADATAVAGEEWESWSDSSTSSSSSSSSSTASAVSLLSSSSTEGESRGGQARRAGIMRDGGDDDDDEAADADVDGDVPMRDVAAPPPAKDVDEEEDEDTNSPVPPPGDHGAGAGGDEKEGLRALLKMRNAFMRGEMR